MIWAGSPAATVRGGGHGLFSGHVCDEERGNLIHRDFIEIIVEVGVVGIGYYEQFLIVAVEQLERVLAEVARVGLLTVNYHDGTFKFAGIFKEFEVDKGESRGDIPSVGGVA